MREEVREEVRESPSPKVFLEWSEHPTSSPLFTPPHPTTTHQSQIRALHVDQHPIHAVRRIQERFRRHHVKLVRHVQAWRRQDGLVALEGGREDVAVDADRLERQAVMMMAVAMAFVEGVIVRIDRPRHGDEEETASTLLCQGLWEGISPRVEEKREEEA